MYVSAIAGGPDTSPREGHTRVFAGCNYPGIPGARRYWYRLAATTLQMQ